MIPAANSSEDSTVGRLAGRTREKPITLKLTRQELELLTALAADQLFRREFIDPKLPGYRPKLGELSIEKRIVTRLRALTDPRVVRKAAGAAE